MHRPFKNSYSKPTWIVRNVTIVNIDDVSNVWAPFVDVFFVSLDVILTQGVSLRTNLNIDSTKLAGVDSVHFSNAPTTHCCNLSISLE